MPWSRVEGGKEANWGNAQKNALTFDALRNSDVNNNASGFSEAVIHKHSCSRGIRSSIGIQSRAYTV